jgi:hypothetical protein
MGLDTRVKDKDALLPFTIRFESDHDGSPRLNEDGRNILFLTLLERRTKNFSMFSDRLNRRLDAYSEGMDREGRPHLMCVNHLTESHCKRGQSCPFKHPPTFTNEFLLESDRTDLGAMDFLFHWETNRVRGERMDRHVFLLLKTRKDNPNAISKQQGHLVRDILRFENLCLIKNGVDTLEWCLANGEASSWAPPSDHNIVLGLIRTLRGEEYARLFPEAKVFHGTIRTNNECEATVVGEGKGGGNGDGKGDRNVRRRQQQPQQRRQQHTNHQAKIHNVHSTPRYQTLLPPPPIQPFYHPNTSPFPIYLHPHPSFFSSSPIPFQHGLVSH